MLTDEKSKFLDKVLRIEIGLLLFAETLFPFLKAGTTASGFSEGRETS
jgi:hypothetical protein